MENASKALIMAGGALVAILVASFMALMLRSGGQMSSALDSRLSQNDLAKFNSQFEFYDRQDNNIFDIITVANLAYDANKKNSYDVQNSVNITVEIKTGNQRGIYVIKVFDGSEADKNEHWKRNYFYKTSPGTASDKYMYDLVPEYSVKEEAIEADGRKNWVYTHKFKCESLEYSTITGKVCDMKFKLE